MSKKERCSAFCQISPPFKIKVVDFKAPCLFFRRRGEEFKSWEIVPEGICPALFFHLYPQYLSLLYNGKPGERIVHCPGTGGKTIWRVGRQKLLIYPFLNLSEKFFRLIGQPKDLVDKKIIIEFLKSEGSCPKGYSKKTSFSFNHYRHLYKKRYFCPALFYTLYPHLIKPEGEISPKTKKLRLQCPSQKSAIVVEIIR